MSDRFAEYKATSVVVGLFVTLVVVLVFQSGIGHAFDSLLAVLR